MTELQGKIAVVTGASRGIGKAIAIELAKGGADIVINFKSDKKGAEDTAQKVIEAGQQAFLYPFDVSSASEIKTAFKKIQKEQGRIDILVNNAGITKDNITVLMKPEEWDIVIKTNLSSVYLCSQAVIKSMLKHKWGRIINITSVVGFIGNPGQSNYAAAKAGIVGFTKTLARELASRNITVNAVAPGYIETDMTAALPDEARKSLLAQIPMGYVGKPEDVAAAVRFLASDNARYITGQVIHVNGGMYM